MRHVPARRPHRLRQDDVRRQLIYAPFQKLERTARVRRVDAAREQASRLHHLMPRVMHRRRRVIHAAHERKLVRELRDARENLAHLDVGIVGADWLKRPANLARRIRFHVEGVELRGRAEIENKDARLIARALRHRARRLRGHHFGKRKSERAERADLEEISAREAVASGDGAGAGDVEHVRGILKLRESVSKSAASHNLHARTLRGCSSERVRPATCTKYVAGWDIGSV